jgi:hypothetical protein
VAIFAPKAEAAWCALDTHFAARLRPVELDYLYALFVFGLTLPSFANNEPDEHFEICRTLLELKLSPERAEAALHVVPEAKEAWVEAAYKTMERRGIEMGLTVAKQDAAQNAGAADDEGLTPTVAAETTESCNE